MSISKKVLLLVGSPRGLKSNSLSLSSYIIDNLSQKGFNTETVAIISLLNSNESLNNLINDFFQYDLVILATPLYVDQLPAPTIALLEIIANSSKNIKTTKKISFTALLNCGFPEASQNKSALDICRLFCKETGLEWFGGIAIGMGESINKQNLKNLGGMVKKLTIALDEICDKLSRCKPFDDTNTPLFLTPSIPKSLYSILGSLNWISIANKNKTLFKLYRRPFDEN